MVPTHTAQKEQLKEPILENISEILIVNSTWENETDRLITLKRHRDSITDKTDIFSF